MLSKQRPERRRSKESTAKGKGTQIQTENIQHARKRTAQLQSREEAAHT